MTLYFFVCAGKRSSFILSVTTVWNKIVELYNVLTAFLWRLAEIHIHKVVMLTLFILCILEVHRTRELYAAVAFASAL